MLITDIKKTINAEVKSFMNYRKFRFVLGILILLFINSGAVLAQTSGLQNISTINVDDLSDAQVKQVMQQAEAAGLSDADLLQQAQIKGMSASEASKLQTRITELRGKETASSATVNQTGSNQRSLNYTPDTLNTPANRKDSAKNAKPPIFGANIFKNKDMSFEPNLRLATPANYIIGPEDQIDINVYGKSVVNWKLTVTPEGVINIPGAGLLNVNGKTIEQATAAIKAKLSASNYAVGRGTNVQVSLGNIRSIKVIIIGQVIKPGTYTLPSLATVFNALYAAGGPGDQGSFRQIEIIRSNKIIRHLDIYDFLVKGDQSNNINLQDQDIIRVPTYRTRVELSGAVKIPALFEVLPGETLQSVIDFAGGFSDQAYTARIKVSQISDQQRRITDVLEDDYKNYIPLRGDKYTVSHILNRFENRVSINGAVFRPGEYELQKGLTLSALIKNAAGLREDAFTGRGNITRLKPDNTTELIPFDVQGILNKSAVDIPLQREDSVMIYSIFSLRDKYNVVIKGGVRKPGTFAYADSMTVEDLIMKSGGFAEGASPKRVEVARRIDNSDPSSTNSLVAQVFSVNVDTYLKASDLSFKLKPYDAVSVYTLPGYEKQKTVRVEGEVLYPGYYTIEKKNEKVSDILKRAGGLSASANVDGGTLKRNNIAILGIDKNKADTAEIARDRINSITRLGRNYSDSNVEDTLMRNNYVGIDLKDILEKPGSSIDLLLEDGDEIRIPKQQQIVRVNGQVLYPSAVVYSDRKSFKDYVLNAGGYSYSALRRGAYIVYPNGTVKGTRKFLFFNNHPGVKPGSEIYVPKKAPSTNNGLQQILAFTTGFASLGAIILGILSLNR
jgi:protein involved in polysaccharide export with SLBB domain